MTSNLKLNEVREHVADIWRDFLNVSKINCYDDFFDLGGNSLSSIKMIVAVAGVFEVDIDFESFFDNPTLKCLIDLVVSEV